MKNNTLQKFQSNSISLEIWRRPLLELLLLITIIVVFYLKTIYKMVELWSASDTYAHGFIVPLISLWLIWRIRKNWAKITPEHSYFAGLLIFFVVGLWLLGDLVAVNAVTQLAFVMLLGLSVPAVLGWRIAAEMAFPLLFLFFAVPIGDFMLPAMMEWTADFTIVALRFTGIPVYREGLQFIIPSGTWSVVEACSGIRYLIASVTVGCLFAYINYQSFLKRIIFIIFAMVVPLIANWMRAYMIVLIGHYSGNELATGVDHLIYGWLFFGMVMALMLFLGVRWSDETSVNAKIFDKKINNNFAESLEEKNFKYNKNYGFLIIIVFTLALPHVLQIWFASNTRKLPVYLEEVLVVPPWKNTKITLSDWKPLFLHAAAQSHSSFENAAGEQVGLYINYYRQQNYKSKLVTSTNNLVTNKNRDWIILSRENKLISLNNTSFKVNSTILRSSNHNRIESNPSLHVWHFYWVNEKFTASDIQAKIQGALSRILGKGDDGAIIAIYVPFIPSDSDFRDAELANGILKNFLKNNEDALIYALQKTRGLD